LDHFVVRRKRGSPRRAAQDGRRPFESGKAAMALASAAAPVKTAGDQNFQTVVLERSKTVPVLVDFWAPWCGPCKVVGPVLEKLAAEMAGRFELVKVNMDESPLLAQALMIQSIPAVKLIVNGEIRDEFVGAYPEPEVRRFLEHHLPPPAAVEAVKGLGELQAGHPEDAERKFQEILAKEPKNAVALLGMARIHFAKGDHDAAKALAERVNELELDKLPNAKAIARDLASLQGMVFLAEQLKALEGAADTSETGALFRKAAGEALGGAYDQALEDFLAVVKRDRAFRQDAGRKGMLAVFSCLPPDSPLVDDYRAKLSMLLFR